MDTLVSDRINSLDLSDINIAHFGTNGIAKQIILEMELAGGIYNERFI